MTIIKLVDGTTINATDVELAYGILKITTEDHTVEELAAIFSDKQKTSHIKLLTVAGVESGFQDGFTSFAGIQYTADGIKTVALFQPIDDLERRVATAEGVAAGAATTAEGAATAAEGAVAVANTATEKTMTLDEQMVVLASTLDSVLTDVIPSLMMEV